MAAAAAAASGEGAGGDDDATALATSYLPSYPSGVKLAEITDMLYKYFIQASGVQPRRGGKSGK